MSKKERKQVEKKNKAYDVDRMINEGLAGGWEGEDDRNGSIYDNELNDIEEPPTLNGKTIT